MKRVFCFGVTILGLALSAQATVLTFEPDSVMSSGSAWGGFENSINQNYGDRAVASPDGNGFTYTTPDTPNVTVDYAPQYFDADADAVLGVRYVSPTSIYNADNSINYGPTGDLLGVIYNAYGNLPNEATSNKWTVTFTADPGYKVVLHSFDIAGIWWGTAPGTDLTVTGDTTFTQSYTNLAMSGSHVLVSPGVQGQVVTVQFDDVEANFTAADNFYFTQVAVPEPSALALLALAGLAMRRRR